MRRLITGTDAGMAPFDKFPGALRSHEDRGFTGAQILEMASVTTASALGLGTTAGTQQTGYSADLLVVSPRRPHCAATPHAGLGPGPVSSR
ncbi:MAG: Imidazolonepropionase [Pseudonocardiales bacterium]|nr:Imidazolonepropionase [Pseudonocardiales bacterium]